MRRSGNRDRYCLTFPRCLVDSPGYEVGRVKLAFRGYFVLAVAVLLAVSSAALAADYPRRVAIAPFTILGSQEEIWQTVEILPRLLSSRLMAMTGAEVLLLSPQETSPADAAKRAGMPLLLKGTVAKLGAGYSIDLTVTDLADGKTAGAFFTAAGTQDDIIPRLGDLAADVSEKIFGVKGARAHAPSPAAQPQAAPPAVSVPAVAPAPVPSGAPGATAAAQAAPAAAPTPAQTAAPAKDWIPSSIQRAGQSDKIADEIYGVVAGDVDDEGNGEVVAYGKNTIYIYRVQGTEVLPYTRISRSRDHHFLNVEAVDLDGDGKKEILVTDLVKEMDLIQSFVLKRTGDVYEEAAGKIPYFLVVLPDWMGKTVVAGQHQGNENPFRGKIVMLRWDGKGFAEGDPLPQNTDILPLSQGVLGLSSARFEKESRLIYTDETSRLRIVDDKGESQYKSSRGYGSSVDFFEWGPYIQIDGRRKPYPLRKAARVAPGGRELPLVLIPEAKEGLLGMVGGVYESTRLVLLQWDGGDFQEKAGTPGSGQFLSGADFLSPSGLRRGGKVVASVIEKTGVAWREQISRLDLFQLE
jgi:hypothetical protein